MVNVLIVDDERCIQRLYQMDIEGASDRYSFAGSIASADNVEIFCSTHNVNLILMDINTADNSSGIEATREIKKKYPKIKVIVTTSYTDPHTIDLAKEAGADSFWFKDFSSIELLEVMDLTMEGKNYWPEEIPNVKLGMSFLNQFTKTEREVLYYLVEYISIKKIADKMCVEDVTIKTHLRNMCQKAGCGNKTELLVLAMQAKVVLPRQKNMFK